MTKVNNTIKEMLEKRGHSNPKEASKELNTDVQIMDKWAKPGEDPVEWINDAAGALIYSTEYMQVLGNLGAAWRTWLSHPSTNRADIDRVREWVLDEMKKQMR